MRTHYWSLHQTFVIRFTMNASLNELIARFLVSIEIVWYHWYGMRCDIFRVFNAFNVQICTKCLTIRCVIYMCMLYTCMYVWDGDVIWQIRLSADFRCLAELNWRFGGRLASFVPSLDWLMNRIWWKRLSHCPSQLHHWNGGEGGSVARSDATIILSVVEGEATASIDSGHCPCRSTLQVWTCRTVQTLWTLMRRESRTPTECSAVDEYLLWSTVLANSSILLLLRSAVLLLSPTTADMSTTLGSSTSTFHDHCSPLRTDLLNEQIIKY